jgi:UDP-2-acetamido-3-amino-2,3-dideoxy-glucuronate N-acetyltransferase
VKIAVIGCGGWGKNIARNLRSLGVLGQIVDPSPVAKELSIDLGVPFSNVYEDAIEDNEIVGVAIAAPATMHFSIAMQALRAGKHVFVEKPIALSVADAHSMKSLAADTGRILMVGHLLQYHPAFIILLQMCSDGELGPLSYISSNRMSLGRLRAEENISWSFAPHDISMLIALAGRVPDRVMAIGYDALQPGIPDIANLHLDFGRGLHGDVRVSWLHPEKEQKLVVVGKDAMAIFSDREDWQQKLKIIRQPVQWEGQRPIAHASAAEPIPVSEGEPLMSELQHFLDCIQTGRQPRTDADEASAVLSVLAAAQKSMDEDSVWVSL